MKVAILDRQVLNAMPPLDVAAYLRLNRWQNAPYLGDKAFSWTGTDKMGDKVVMLQPLLTEFGDYADRMAEILHTLERCEQRSQLAIHSDILTVTTDVIRVRVTADEAFGGSIPLEDGPSLVQSARDMLRAAACSASAPKPAWLRRRPEEAEEYMRRTRLGQTEHGSFVLRILSKVPPAIDGDMFEEPFERRVTKTLSAGLEQARVTAQDGAIQRPPSGSEIGELLSAVEKGLSYNLCDSLANLGTAGSEAEREVDVAISWAAVRRPPTDTPAHFRFSRDSFAYIRAVGRRLRHIAPQDDFEIEGQVIRLDQSKTAEKITVRAPVDGQPRHVRMDLPEAFRAHAIHAYDQRSTIRCEGELVSEGNGFRLSNVRGFQVIAEGQSLHSAEENGSV